MLWLMEKYFLINLFCKNDIRTYDNIRKTATGLGLSKQQALDADTKAI